MWEKTKNCLPADHVTSTPHLQAQVFHQGHVSGSCHRDSAAHGGGTNKRIAAGDFSLSVSKAESRKGQRICPSMQVTTKSNV